MTAHLRELWDRRSPREQRLVKACGAVLAIALAVWLVQSANVARSRLLTSVTALKGDAMRLDRDAAEIERLRKLPPPSASRNDLRTVFRLQSDAAGLSAAIVRLDASGPDQITVGLGAVAFADWLALLQRLQAHQVRPESARFEALSGQGLVSVTATLTRASPQ